MERDLGIISDTIYEHFYRNIYATAALFRDRENFKLIQVDQDPLK